MASLTRPPLRSSTERRVRHTKSPATEVENNTQHHSTAVATRRSSRSTPLLALGDEKPAKSMAQPPVRPATRKRPASALLAEATDTRPPTKVTVTQPHGELLRITNGVPQSLGIRHDELSSGVSTPRANGAAARLTVPPASAGTQAQDKRSLRSQDGGSRLKSDLAIYFSSYDDIIAGLPKPPELVDVESPIYIVDEPLKTAKRQPPKPVAAGSRASASPSRSRKAKTGHSCNSCNSSIAASPSSTAFQVLDYSTIARHLPDDGGDDPLAEDVFAKQHRRAERKEKQLRNIEKERAMHEKVQLERLLDGLQGPDWLKVMGITGVTDGDRKDWEPKRHYFVREVEALVDKFRIWKEEEKRIRAEREAALAAREEEEEGDDDDEGKEEAEAEASSESDVVNVNGPAPSTKPEPPKPRRPPRPHGFVLSYLPPEPPAPFVSFYSKPHLRAAALGKHRHGRNATAFGHPVPDFDEHEFEPPEEYLTPDALRDHARKRRRQKRESGAKT